MDSSLGRGFYEVYSSSKEIINNNQRHLFCNMLDLLSNTTKSTPPAIIEKIISSDDLVRFWLEDILPLVFDNDTSIQGSAVSALEQGLLILNIGTIHNYKSWNNIKNIIVKEYASRLHELREGRSHYWHRVWCILIKLLDKEILKSASTINLYLSIVELGFRSPDNTVRAEAFTCWHLLIQIFAAHNQLSSPKRLKLVCIPLKSSQSKTPYVAAVKLRIWWYLITCLGEQIEENFENVVEAFFIFCYGSELKSTPGVVHQYVTMREPALTCLAAIMITERDELLQRLLREYELESCPRLPIMSCNIVEKHWKPILFAVLEATRLIIENDKPNDLEQRLLSVIVRSSALLVINIDLASLYEYFCSGLVQIVSKSCRPISIVTNVIATDGLRFSRSLSDFDNYVQILECLIKFLTFGRNSLDSNKIQQCITQISSLDAFVMKRVGWRVVSAIAEYLFKMPSEEGFEYFEVKFLIWRQISSDTINCIRNNTFGRSVEDFTDVLISWSLWPLRMVMEFTGCRSATIFDENFYSLWHNLLQLTENTLGRTQHLKEIGSVLTEISKCEFEWGVFVQLFNVYVDEVIKHECSTFTRHYEKIFSIFSYVIQRNLPQKEKEKLLTVLRCVLHKVKTPEHNSLLEPIKSSIRHAIQSSSKGAVDLKFFEEWKHSIINIIRTSMEKNSVSQLTDLFKDDLYVIIPSVWSLKPEKLTDRQKERFAEKTSIPALYNDMSQSQDTLIKPWTPKKIVIAKEDQNEIIIESSNIRQGQFNFDTTEKLEENNDQRNGENEQDLPNSTTDKLNCKETTKLKQSEKEEASRKQKQDIDGETFTNSKAEHAINCESLQGLSKNPTEDVSKTQSNDIHSGCSDGSKTQSNDIHSGCSDGSKMQSNDIHSGCSDGKTELPNSYLGAEIAKEVSPKRSSTRNALLLSPPDRRLTNNNSSPKLRPKPPAHLTGRGAQFINMIRNKKVETQSPQTPMPRLCTSKNDSMDRTASDMDMLGMENTSTPLHTKDILTFSKRLPSPSASPSTSILKRNFRRDSLEEIALDSPACKKKRVSFHDPPVSVTKEYIKHNDENKTKPKRCLIMDKVQSSAEKGSENKCTLKRRSKLDSIIEIEKFSFQQSNKVLEQPTNNNLQSEISYDENTSCLDYVPNENKTIDKISAPENSNNNYNETELETNTSLTNSENILQMDIQRYTLQELIEKYLEFGKDSKLKCYNTMAKLISKGMSDDYKVKENVLEALSENHSKDFLDHAIRENLASVVCDRLNLPSVIEYVCEKSKINSACRSNLFLQIPDIMKCCKQDAERLKLSHAILSSKSFKDHDILDLINTLMRTRCMDRSNLATVSEAAIDSSSNL